MAVRVNKSPINIREKLNELDYAQVPYEKMPAGSVIQVATQRATTSLETSSTSYVDIDDMTINFYPKYADSKVWINVMSHYYVQTSSANPWVAGWTGVQYQLLSDVHGIIIEDNGYGEALYTASSTQRYMGTKNFSIAHTPNTTGLIEYKVQGKAKGAAVRFHYDAYGLQGLITIMEIRQ